MPPGRILGLDFSGARNAGRSIWLAEGQLRGTRLTIQDCRAAQHLPGGGTARSLALHALVETIAASVPCVVACDFPFALHHSHSEAESWEQFMGEFASRYPTEESLYARTHRKRKAGREPRRETEIRAQTPWAANNLRLFRQTYHGIRHVLRPLQERGAAAVLPMQEPLPGRAWLLEVCPASALKRIRRYAPYKGGALRLRRVRARLLDSLNAPRVNLSPALRRRIIAQPGGDALDSVIAAWVAAQVLLGARRDRNALMPPLSLARKIEGWVYC